MSESGKPPGSFGWFGGASDSAKFASNPVEYVGRKTEKHGGVFCSKIAGMPAVFAGGYAQGREVFTDDDSFPPPKSMLELIQKPVGQPFLLSKDKAKIKYWRVALSDAINALTPEDVRSVLEPVIDSWIGKTIDNLYQSAKNLFNKILFTLLFNLSEADVEKLRLPELQTTQFRGCEAIPVEGLPTFMQSSFEKGIDARVSLNQIVTTLLKTKKLGPLGNFLHTRAQADGKSLAESAEHITFLMHGIVPKAMASGLLYTWGAMDKNWAVKMKSDPTLVEKFVKESLRVNPPVGVMGRGVTSAKFSGYNLDAKHGEWKAFVGVASGNMDAAAYGPLPKNFTPSRWDADKQAPEPLTFGAGARACPGSGMATQLLELTVHHLLSRGVCPVVKIGAEQKTLPVLRPTEKVECRFVKF